LPTAASTWSSGSGPDANGDIEVLKAFWDVAEEAAWQGELPNDIVPPLLAYANLMASTDSRNNCTDDP
jgi:hypothetical protein